MARARVRPAASALAAFLLALAGSAGPAAAQAEGSSAIVVGGLRPAADSAYESTDLKRLPEAQHLREIIDQGVKDVTQRPVVNHAALRAALGSAYLVAFFDCKGAVKCVSRVFAKVRSQGSLVVYGDYTVKKKNALARLRLVDLASGKLLAEHEFSLKADEIEDAEAWKRQLSVLLAAVEIAKPPGGGGGGGETAPEGGAGGQGSEGDGGGGQASEGGGQAAEGGAGDTGGGESGGQATDQESASAHGTDELTDADFGEVATADLSVVRSEKRDEGAFLSLAAGFTMWARRFDFVAAEGFERLRPPSFKSGWSGQASGSLELFPFSLKSGGLLSGVGLVGEISRSVTLGSFSAKASDQRLLIGGLYRIAIGSSDTLPTIKILGGYLMENIELVDSEIDLPDVAYRAVVAGGEMRVPIATPRVSLNGGARYLLVNSAGDILSPDTYGSSRVAGLEFDASLDIQPVDNLLFRIGGSYSRLVLDFDGNGELSSSGAIGARDRFFAGTVAAGLLL